MDLSGMLPYLWCAHKTLQNSSSFELKVDGTSPAPAWGTVACQAQQRPALGRCLRQRARRCRAMQRSRNMIAVALTGYGACETPCSVPGQQPRNKGFPRVVLLFLMVHMLEIGGPCYGVKLGKKDGFISQASRVPGYLPLPTMPVTELAPLFSSKGFSFGEMVALVARTIGFSHCTNNPPISAFNGIMIPNKFKEIRRRCVVKVKNAGATRNAKIAPELLFTEL
ncbi:Peroxidase 63 [Nymphaea thermarum]|nr:Peroxidase 63 [Nymphaea thermarum]